MAAETNALETFLRDYADVVGGLWDEVEPQVFDLMLPPPAAPAGGGAGSRRWSGSPSTPRRSRNTPGRSSPASAPRWSTDSWRTRCSAAAAPNCIWSA